MKILKKQPNKWFLFLMYGFISITLLTEAVLPAQAVQAASQRGGIWGLPAPGVMVKVTAGFAPPVIRGMILHPENPLLFDFIVNTGDTEFEGEAFKREAIKLVKYFLASLTIPEEEMWVNLSPYEEGRVIPESLGVTEMGVDMLAQDYMLKQLTASLMYPEEDLGADFWKRVRKQAGEKFGASRIPMNTFHKVWIIPDEAEVYEYEGKVFVTKKHLKVMLEADYHSLGREAGVRKKGNKNPEEKIENRLSKTNNQSSISTKIVREIILPEIEREVNEGKNFAKLRQIFNSMILATWYKKSLKESLLGQVYVDLNKIKGIDVADKEIKQKIYGQYLAAFKQGVFNYIREDYDQNIARVIPRKYFSGGIVVSAPLSALRADSLVVHKGLPGKQSSPVRAELSGKGKDKRIRVFLEEAGSNQVSISDVEIDKAKKSMVKILMRTAADSFDFSDVVSENLVRLFDGAKDIVILQDSIAETIGMGRVAFAMALQLVDKQADAQTLKITEANSIKDELAQRKQEYFDLYLKQILDIDYEDEYPEEKDFKTDDSKTQAFIRHLLIAREGRRIDIENAMIGFLLSFEKELHYFLSDPRSYDQDRLCEGECSVEKIMNILREYLDGGMRGRTSVDLGHLPRELEKIFAQARVDIRLADSAQDVVVATESMIKRVGDFIDNQLQGSVGSKFTANFANHLKIIKKQLVDSRRRIIRPVKSDNAMSSAVKGENAPGGIDLNAGLLDLQIKRDGQGVPLPLSQQIVGDIHIEGLIPVILNVAPINVPLLLGLADPAENIARN